MLGAYSPHIFEDELNRLRLKRTAVVDIRISQGRNRKDVIVAMPLDFIPELLELDVTESFSQCT